MSKPKPQFDRYYRYAELTRTLHDYAERFPELCRLHSIGKSHEGRDIWLATVSHLPGGADQRPALWLDGNIHSAELVGSMACLYFIDYLLNGYGEDAEVTRCLDSRTFYICPRINPDGAEWALADTPRLVRSSIRPWPWSDGLAGGLRPQDINGDGRILSMRIPDPDGHWKISSLDPRLMVAREPTEAGGEYYRLLPEGLIEEFDGVNIPVPPLREGLDLNRNFPCEWRAEQQQKGAGPFPASEPEVNAVVRFISTHPNICSGIAFHSYSGVLLRPFSHRPDEDMIPEDRWTFEALGKKGSELTGYPAVSAYHEFRYHPRQVITGALDDWLYQELGRFAWTVEIWSPQREAGISDYHYIDWYRQHPVEDDLKLLAWNDGALQGRGFVPWQAFEHPQLGSVEVGGWEPLYSFWNPPPRLLERELQRFPKWLLWHNLISPLLAIKHAEIKSVGPDLWQLRVVVHNSGWLPTYISKQAQDKKQARGVLVQLQLPEPARLVSGKTEQELGQLEGRAHKPASPFGWSGQISDPTDQQTSLEWIIQAPPGTAVTVSVRHDHAGSMHQAYRLET